MSLPTSIQNLFSDTFEGMPAARLKSSVEVHNLQTALREHRVSHLTKILKRKKQREFVVILPEQATAHAA